MKGKIIKSCKVIIFLSLLVIIFSFFEMLYMPKFFYPNTFIPESPTQSIDGFYMEENNSLDVIFLGPSHMVYGISPMRLYRDTGITSYNLGTSTQPVECSYYLLKEALKTQSPQVVVMDVNNIFYDTEVDDAFWKIVINSMHMGQNKINLVLELAEDNSNYDILNVLNTITYHDRSEELSMQDFEYFFMYKKCYSKGVFMNPVCRSGVYTEEDIENDVNTLAEKNIYKCQINEDKLIWINMISDLCQENNIIFIPTLIPSCNSLRWYEGSVYKQKYELLRESLPNDNVFDFYSDGNISIDWTKDTSDYGAHLNYLGAIKATDCIAGKLTNLVKHHSESKNIWKDDELIYNEIEKTIILKNTWDYFDYFELLKNFEDVLIIATVSDDFSFSMDDLHREALKSINIDTKFDASNVQQSFVFVKDNDNVIFEKASDVALECTVNYNNLEIEVRSSGWWTGDESVVSINGINYSQNSRGLNVVVIDKHSESVMDSVAFDNFDEFKCTHGNYLNQFKKYEEYMIENRY